MSAEPALLVIIDPAARRSDAESVRVALDVLRSSARVKIVLIDDALDDVERVLEHRRRRRVVVVGGSRLLDSVVTCLHRRRELTTTPLGMVPLGAGGTAALFAQALGLPVDPAKAARVVLGGRERLLDLLVDDAGAAATGGVRIRAASPARTGAHRHAGAVIHGSQAGPGGLSWRWWVAETTRRLSVALGGAPRGTELRLRVEADGMLLCDLDEQLVLVGVGNGVHAPDIGWAVMPVRPDDGLADVAIFTAPGTRRRPVTVRDGLMDEPGVTGGGHGGAADQAARGSTGPAGPVEPRVRVPHPAPHLQVRTARARTITVHGRGFVYDTDGAPGGPVHRRTWTVLPQAWRLQVASS